MYGTISLPHSRVLMCGAKRSGIPVMSRRTSCSCSHRPDAFTHFDVLDYPFARLALLKCQHRQPNPTSSRLQFIASALQGP